VKRWLKRIAFAFAVFLLLLTIVNASWIAGKPQGGIRLIAHRGVYQLFDHKGLDRYRTCTATRIEQPVHDYLENTIRSIRTARQMGADMVEIDVAPTADGKMAVYHDWTLDCRTEGKGDVRSATMAQLKQLDPGYGYTSDGGKTFPFRGKQKGSIPSLQEVLEAVPSTPLMFNFKSKDPAEADQLARELAAARRDPAKLRDGFYGHSGPIDRLRQIHPDAWAWSIEGAKKCSKDYVLTGWTGIVPESCRDGTIIIPINYQPLFWGWPNRLIKRMDSVGARVIVTGPYGGENGMGLALPEQLGKVPNSFKGYIWVEDIWTVGPALRPGRDVRSKAQIDAAEAGLNRRRESAR
jgi:glycerophosphoryl diester phosphodiesterase